MSRQLAANANCSTALLQLAEGSIVNDTRQLIYELKDKDAWVTVNITAADGLVRDFLTTTFPLVSISELSTLTCS